MVEDNSLHDQYVFPKGRFAFVASQTQSHNINDMLLGVLVQGASLTHFFLS